MFTSLKRVTYQVPQLDKARQWYAALLDSEPALDSPFLVTFLIGDASLTLVPTTDGSLGSDERVAQAAAPGR